MAAALCSGKLMFDNQLSILKSCLVCVDSVCPFLCCKYSQHSHPQGASVVPVNIEQTGDAHGGFASACRREPRIHWVFPSVTV